MCVYRHVLSSWLFDIDILISLHSHTCFRDEIVLLYTFLERLLHLTYIWYLHFVGVAATDALASINRLASKLRQDPEMWELEEELKRILKESN